MNQWSDRAGVEGEGGLAGLHGRRDEEGRRLRVPSGPEVLGGVGYPLGREALEERAQGSLDLASWMTSQTTRNVWS